MTPYQFVFQLQDLFSSPLARIAGNYTRVTGDMQRKAQVISKVFAPVGNSLRRSFTQPQGSVAELTKQLEQLREKAKGIDVRINRRDLIDTNRDIDWLERRIDKLQNTGRRRQRGSSGGGLGFLATGGLTMGLAYGAYNVAEAAYNKTVSPAMTRQMQEFQLGFQLGDQAKGKALSKQIGNLAVANPFLKSGDAFSVAPSLLTAGFKQEEITSKLSIPIVIEQGIPMQFAQLWIT